MKLACGDHSFPLLDHDHVVELIRMLGFDAVDIAIMGGRSHVQPEDISRDVPGWTEKLAERVRGRGLEFSDIFLIPWGWDIRPMAVNHPDPDERGKAAAMFRDVLELTAALQAKGMTIPAGVDWEELGHEDSLKRASEELAWRVEEARARGVRLSVEPGLGSVIPTPDQALALVEMTPGLELTLDYAHFVYQGIPEADAEPLISHSRHFHARGARRLRLQASMKENEIGFERIIDVMRVTGYDGFLALEYVWMEWEHCNECDNLSETILLRDRLRAKLSDAEPQADWRNVGSLRSIHGEAAVDVQRLSRDVRGAGAE